MLIIKKKKKKYNSQSRILNCNRNSFNLIFMNKTDILWRTKHGSFGSTKKIKKNKK